MFNVLLVEDDIAFNKMLETFLTKKGFHVTATFSIEAARKELKSATHDLVLTDLRLPDGEGTVLLSEVKLLKTAIPIIMMTNYSDVKTAVEAMKKGAYDYVSKPFRPDEIIAVIDSALKPSKPEVSAKIATSSGKRATLIEGKSEASKRLSEFIRLVAPTDMSVLIWGESGTGKEYVAKAIHDKSLRAQHPFVAVDCGAIPRAIAASEFFGHVKGSFTGATMDKIGHFEAANKGTLFLDEVGNLSYENQINLLRALQERKVKPVGSTMEISVDIRVIAATNEDLGQAVKEGKFREDLYHRLNEFIIEVPKLYDRQQDVLLFANHFLQSANDQLDKNIAGFSEEVIEIFNNYNWPGNIREMGNLIKRATLLEKGNIITTEALPRELLRYGELNAQEQLLSKHDNEKQMILKAMEKTRFNKTKAAKILGVDRKTLYNKIKQYDLKF
ncbi:sigma-54-dependent transcriptional regulator [Sungkyunkwania multivorans]|uniref:Sigma-54-dependent transcriptional regulator n=1 Tax=Sungkyunkwania multivorans TaxID=1173618 RepID=A0ABW3D2I0_9FLAO